MQIVMLVSLMGLVCGTVLVIAAKFMAVPTDERETKIREALPGANCGACGFAGCDDYAKHVAMGDVKPNLCVPGGECTAKKISEIMGVEFENVEPKKAYVRCNGNFDSAQFKLDYEGQKTCRACNLFYSGRRACTYGCLGYGDCVNACKFDAIDIVNGLAEIDWSMCTGCGACEKVCPNNIIDLRKASSRVYVACSSHDKGGAVRKVCSTGCIGCMKCQKTCEHDAIHVVNFLASIDYDKCVNCGKCAEVCPSHVIQIVKE